jgi:arsenate reductase (glutaredoxin)
MIKGTVKFFNGTKGFGFITPDDGSKEVFVPSATVTASGTGLLKAGQRVSFEAEQEAKGPKAVKLTLLDEPLREVPRDPSRDPSRDLSRDPSRDPSRDQARETRSHITLYHEADTDESADVMAALADAGCTPRQVDYTATPPSRDELKRLAVMLRSANQSLARRYEPLFMELRLDDRFISENEFWTAIAEHPTLINGPILVSSNKALICKSAEDVHAFLGNGASDEKRPKAISARMAAMMAGHAVPPAPPVVERETRTVEAPAKSVMHEKPEPAVKIKLAPRARAAEAPKKTVVAAAKKLVAPAKPVKAKAPKPKAAAKPVKKAKK